MLSKASKRCLTTEEILRNVLELCECGSLYSCMTVCKQWSDVALDLAWNDIQEPLNLFGLLSYVTEDDHGNVSQFEFYRSPLLKEMERFQKYCSRIRCLRFSSRDEEWSLVIRSVACMPFSTPLLPRLREFEWTTTSLAFQGLSDSSVFLMQPSITKFIYHPKSYMDDGLIEYFHAIRLRMPHLQTFELRQHVLHKVDNWEGLFKLTHELPKLQSLVIPAVSESPAFIFPRLASLPLLKRLAFMPWPEGKGMDKNGRAVDEEADWQLEPESFQNLEQLEIFSPYSPISNFLMQTHHPRHLLDLDITSEVPEDPDVVRQLLSAFAAAAPRARRVRLAYRTDLRLPPEFGDRAHAASKSLTFIHIEPLFHCKEITTFEILHPYPVARDGIDDIAQLASAWPLLEVLNLNVCPSLQGFPDVFTLPINALLPLARHCHRLHTLKMFMRAYDPGDLSLPCDDVVGCVTTECPFHFQALRDLTLATDLEDSSGSVAFFLSHVLPRGCTVHAHSDCYFDGGNPATCEVNPLELNVALEPLRRQREKAAVTVAALQSEIRKLKMEAGKVE